MNITVSHLITQKVCWRIENGKLSAVSVSQIVIFEIDTVSTFERSGMIFHRIDGLDFAVRQGIHQFKAGDFAVIRINDDGLVLFALGMVFPFRICSCC